MSYSASENDNIPLADDDPLGKISLSFKILINFMIH